MLQYAKPLFLSKIVTTAFEHNVGYLNPEETIFSTCTGNATES